MPNKFHLSRVARYVPLALSILLLALVFRGVDCSRLAAHLSAPETLPLVALIVLLPLSLGTRAVRYSMLFNDDGSRLRFVDSTRLLLVGLGLNMFCPASTGDVFKGYFGYRMTGIKERMVSVSVLDKCMALAAVPCLGVPPLLWKGEMLFAGLSLPLVLPLLVLAVGQMLVRRWPEKSRCLDRLTQLLREKLDVRKLVTESRVSSSCFAGAMVLSVVGWLITYTQLYLCFQVLRADVHLRLVLSRAPLLTAVRLNPFASNGLGSDEAAMVFLFNTANTDQSAILASALLYRAVLLVLPGIIGLALVHSTWHTETSCDGSSR